MAKLARQTLQQSLQFKLAPTLGISLATTNDASPKLGSATETTIAWIIRTKTRIAPHPPVPPRISGAPLAGAFPVHSGVTVTMTVATVLVSTFFLFRANFKLLKLFLL